MYQQLVKPAIDKLLALVLLLIASPVLIVVVIVLWINNKGKVFFYQDRVGKDERLFRILKFKTMNDNRDSKGELLPDDSRLTALGRFIRRTSLDELPQLINVLKGEMSIVGPRPLLTEYLSLYNEQQKRRHLTMPGITGWAQVNGRNRISWKQKFDLDIYYVDHLSFGLDVKILWRTIMKVLKPVDVSSESSFTMEKFTGN